MKETECLGKGKNIWNHENLKIYIKKKSYGLILIILGPLNLS